MHSRIVDIFESLTPEQMVAWDRDMGHLDLANIVGGYPSTECEPTFKTVGDVWIEFVTDPVPHWRVRPMGCFDGFTYPFCFLEL